MKIGDIAEQTGLTAYTIRYYERIGLLPFALRDSTGQRVYDASILTWIEFCVMPGFARRARRPRKPGASCWRNIAIRSDSGWQNFRHAFSSSTTR
jgi:hypothetical protein